MLYPYTIYHGLAVQDDPASFHVELQRLATCFFRPEAVTWKDAQSLAKRPRGGKGEASYIRKRPAASTTSGPAPKKAKSSSVTSGSLSPH